MPSPKRPPFLKALLIDTCVFFSGAILGLFLAITAAPGSGIAYFIGFSMLPLAFLFGRGLWESLAELSAIYHWIFRLFKHRQTTASQPNQRPPGSVLPGSFVLVLSCTGSTILAGLVTAMFLTETPFGIVMFRYTLLGLIYGGLCWALARQGFLRDEGNIPG